MNKIKNVLNKKRNGLRPARIVNGTLCRRFCLCLLCLCLLFPLAGCGGDDRYAEEGAAAVQGSLEDESAASGADSERADAADSAGEPTGGKTEKTAETAKAGGLVTLGRFEQDGDEADGPEPIDWIVLDVQDGRQLLLSRDCLDCRPYNTPFGDITWESCSLRAWLNGEFLETAFSEEEQARIPETANSNPANTVTGIDGGRETADRVFLLSEMEINVYFHREEDRWLNGPAQPSQYAVDRGVYRNDDGFAFWWLRTPGTDQYSAAFVNGEGNMYSSGAYADIDYYYGVRPALWVEAG